MCCDGSLRDDIGSRRGGGRSEAGEVGADGNRVGRKGRSERRECCECSVAVKSAFSSSGGHDGENRRTNLEDWGRAVVVSGRAMRVIERVTTFMLLG